LGLAEPGGERRGTFFWIHKNFMTPRIFIFMSTARDLVMSRATACPPAGPFLGIPSAMGFPDSQSDGTRLAPWTKWFDVSDGLESVADTLSAGFKI